GDEPDSGQYTFHEHLLGCQVYTISRLCFTAETAPAGMRPERGTQQPEAPPNIPSLRRCNTSKMEVGLFPIRAAPALACGRTAKPSAPSCHSVPVTVPCSKLEAPQDSWSILCSPKKRAFKSGVRARARYQFLYSGNTKANHWETVFTVICLGPVAGSAAQKPGKSKCTSRTRRKPGRSPT